MKYTVEATYIPEIFTLLLKEIGYFPPLFHLSGTFSLDHRFLNSTSHKNTSAFIYLFIYISIN